MIIVIDRGILKREVVEFKYFAMEIFFNLKYFDFKYSKKILIKKTPPLWFIILSHKNSNSNKSSSCLSSEQARK